MSAEIKHDNYKVTLQEAKDLHMLAKSKFKAAVEIMEFYDNHLMAKEAEIALLKQELRRKSLQ